MLLSCCFVPSLLIKKLKSKYTIALSILAYSTYIAAQFYPSLATLAPSGILLGLAAAPLWSAKCTYLIKVRRIAYGENLLLVFSDDDKSRCNALFFPQVGTKYAELTAQNEEVIFTRFFGVFFLFFQSTQVWGNLISSTDASNS